jgi:hypothetical protein
MKSEKRKFKYHKRTSDQVEKRESGGMFDSPFKSKFKSFQPKEGDFCIRILPAQHKGADHYGIDIYTHYGVGAENNRYLCHRKMEKLAPDGECVICEEWEKAKRDDDEEYAKKLRANRQILVWVIDRDHEKEGPKLWCMPGSVDVDVAKLSHNKRTGETMLPEDPDEGHDIDFSRNGKGLNVKYSGIRLGKATPLSDDEEKQEKWLQFVAENPLDEVLNFFEADYIAKVFGGGKAKDEDDEEEEDERPKTRHRKDKDDDDEEEEDERPKKRKREVIDDEDEELDEDDSDDEEKPKRKSKRSGDSDDDDSDDEEEDRPRRKSSRDEDDEDDDEEEDAAPKKRRPADDDEDEDDERPKRRSRDEDDDDDEEEKPRKSMKDRIREGMRKK